jgi:hypothetical protein
MYVIPDLYITLLFLLSIFPSVSHILYFLLVMELRLLIDEMQLQW